MTGGQENWTPMQVLDHALGVSGVGLIEGDFGAFASIFDLPHDVTTFEGNRVLETRADLRDAFDKVRSHFAAHSITNIVRECIAAEFDGADVIKAAHTTRLLANAQQIGETSMAYSVLHLKGSRWLSVSSQYAMAQNDLSTALIVASGSAASNPSDAPAKAGQTSKIHSGGRNLQ